MMVMMVDDGYGYTSVTYIFAGIYPPKAGYGYLTVTIAKLKTGRR